jgi:hypothetical protein
MDFEHEQGDDDGKHAVAERLDAVSLSEAWLFVGWRFLNHDMTTIVLPKMEIYPELTPLSFS